MEGKISDVHDSHGLVFTLNLKKGGVDDEVIDFLHDRLRFFIAGEYRNISTLYLHRIKINVDGVELQFVEASKHDDKVDFTTNTDREDGKFTVLPIEVGVDEVPGGRLRQPEELTGA